SPKGRLNKCLVNYFARASPPTFLLLLRIVQRVLKKRFVPLLSAAERMSWLDKRLRAFMWRVRSSRLRMGQEALMIDSMYRRRIGIFSNAGKKQQGDLLRS